MVKITDADREAAKALRAVLGDISGFWHNFDDDSALCLALARHRLDAENRARQVAGRRGRAPCQSAGPYRKAITHDNDARAASLPVPAA